MFYLEPEVDQRLYSIEDRLPTTITTGPSGNYVEDEEMIKISCPRGIEQENGDRQRFGNPKT